ncbi:DUF4158 domain-containing protein [Streptosporangium canum]|uniref:DUF4158 domain-containing protein n=1 Tax=Streptosporangium canum TaxID=324952 RepID=UPI00379A0706
MDFLTVEEAAAYGRYAGAPSRADPERVFFLDDEDRALAERHRGDARGGRASGRARRIEVGQQADSARGCPQLVPNAGRG